MRAKLRGLSALATALLFAAVPAVAALQGQTSLAAEEALALRLRSFVLQASSWFFLLAALLLVGLVAAKTLQWLREVRCARHPPTRVFRLQLKVRGPLRPLGLYTFDYYPVTVAPRGAADLVLPGAGPGAAALRFDYRHGQAVLYSERPRLVNGAPCRQKRLKSGDRIAFGTYRLDFQDAAIDERPLPVPGKPAFVWQMPVIAGLLALAVVFKQAAGIPEEAGRQQRVIARAIEEAAKGSGREAGAQAPPAALAATVPAITARAPEDALLAMAAADLPDPRRAVARTTPSPERAAGPPAKHEPAAGASATRQSVKHEPAQAAAGPGGPAPQPQRTGAVASAELPPAPLPRAAPRVYAPGEPVQYFQADLLLIHAHPDDESLDFGSLIAGASRSGRRVAVLLFTDGESGLDLYPQRTVGDIYPARKLAGSSLAQVRVVEATRALSVLGAEAYVRLGLLNRPYGSERDVVPLEVVLEGWGGEERLIARLVEIIEGFRPALVLSPDSRSEAHEHFEHEAVGYLVKRTLAVLSPGAPYLKGHLVCVDPYQKDRYRDLITVAARTRDPSSGLELRALQAAALAEHVTQRDAAVLGVARLSRVPFEYYKTLLWREEGPPDLAPYLRP